MVHFLSPHTDGDLTEADRQKELVEKRKKAAFRSSVIGELRQQYSDAPEEIRDRQDFQTERDIREEQHRWGGATIGVEQFGHLFQVTSDIIYLVIKNAVQFQK